MRAVATRSGAIVESPWFTAEQAAAYLQIESEDGSLHAFYLAYPRLGIPAYRLKGGRQLRFHQDDLDAALVRARVQEEEPPRVRAGESERKLALASSNRATSGEENRKPLRRGDR